MFEVSSFARYIKTCKVALPSTSLTILSHTATWITNKVFKRSQNMNFKLTIVLFLLVVILTDVDAWWRRRRRGRRGGGTLSGSVKAQNGGIHGELGYSRKNYQIGLNAGRGPNGAYVGASFKWQFGRKKRSLNLDIANIATLPCNFTLFDENGDSFITLTEFETVLTNLNFNDQGSLFVTMDVNGKSIYKPCNFTLFDENGHSFITLTEFETVLTNLNFNDQGSLFVTMDVNDDDKVTSKEFFDVAYAVASELIFPECLEDDENV